jgi:hypothetical protein
VQPAADLKAIGARINDAHAEAERSLRASVEHAIRAGELLLKAKRSVGHGTWSQWLQDNITFSDRLAQAYMRLARLPLEKRNAVADLPLRDALSAIRSREEQVSRAKERESRPDPGPACFAFTSDDGQMVVVPAPNLVVAPEHRHLMLPSRPLPPAPPPPTAEEIADDLIRQLSQAHYEVRDSITAADLSAAFARHFVEPVPANDRLARRDDGLIEAWDKAGPKQRHDFVLARKVEIMRAQQEVGKWAHESDDGLDIPDLKREGADPGAIAGPAP